VIKSVYFSTLMLVICVSSSFASLVYSTAPRGRGQGGAAFHDWGFLDIPALRSNNNVYDIPNFIDESPYKEIVVQWISAPRNSSNVPYAWETLAGTDAQLLGDEAVIIDDIMAASWWTQ
jgi:hypothetical protein